VSWTHASIAEHARRQANRSRRFRRQFTAPVQRLASTTAPLDEGTATLATLRREGRYHRALAVADAVTMAFIVLVVLPLLVSGVPWSLALAGAALVCVVSQVLGLYDRDDLVLNKSTLDEVPVLAQLATISALLLWLALDGLTAVELDASDVTVLWISTLVLLLFGRVFARWAAGKLGGKERCLVIGTAESISAVRAKLAGGHVKAAVVATLVLDGNQSPDWLGELFRAKVRHHAIDRAIIAPTAAGSEDTLELIRLAKHAGVHVSLLPRMLEVVGSAVEFDNLDGLVMLGVRKFGLSRSARLVKRSFDLVGASVLLALLGPLMLILALAIRLDSRGPIFFRQTRVGRQGQSFAMLKFRSMVVDAEARKDALRHLNQAEGLFKIENDPRITRVGRILRKTSLDELPQLLNVWRGEMSLVGPRPLVVDEDARVHGFGRHRLHLTPGITGNWQILGPTRVPMHEMVGIDYLYVANWSLWNDIKILLRTVPHVLASRGM
jgi:exopolysaccharide biosynthesis polyprenyl glycosylphosphotransferase